MAKVELNAALRWGLLRLRAA